MGKCAMIIALVAGLSNSAFARDDGRYDNDPLKYWFDNLTSSNGRCCSFADGFLGRRSSVGHRRRPLPRAVARPMGQRAELISRD